MPTLLLSPTQAFPLLPVVFAGCLLGSGDDKDADSGLDASETRSVDGDSADNHDGTTSGPADTGPEGETDRDAPIIEHTPVHTPQPIGQDVWLAAVVKDSLSEVASVEVSYKRPEEAAWSTASLEPTDPITHLWEGSIPGDAVSGGNMVYYLRATDSVGNVAFSPVDGEATPYGFRIDPDA